MYTHTVVTGSQGGVIKVWSPVCPPRAGLLLPGRPGPLPAAGHEVRVLPHRHAPQLPPGVQAAEGDPGEPALRRQPANGETRMCRTNSSPAPLFKYRVLGYDPN